MKAFVLLSLTILLDSSLGLRKSSLRKKLQDESFESILPHEQDMNRKTQQRIIGGSNARKWKYRWFSKLYKKTNTGAWKDNGCGGALISPEFVLTAAHCVDDRFLPSIAVRIGAYQYPFTESNNGGVGVEFIEVKAVYLHPRYEGGGFDNDFALLHLEQKSNERPVKIDSNGLSEQYKSGKDLWAAGFGRIAYNKENSKNFPSILQEVDVSYIECVSPSSNYDPSDITDNMMCAAKLGKDACDGDSGGPLIDKLNNVLVGVVSWGDGCAVKGYPGVYSRISAQFDWIQETICWNANQHPGTFCTRSCSLDQMMGKSHHMPALKKCFQMETFEGGIVTFDGKNPTCSKEYNPNKMFSEYDYATDKTIHYKKYKNNFWSWYGKLEVEAMIGSTNPNLSIKRKFRNPPLPNFYFEAKISLPNCDYGCPKANQKVFSLALKTDDYPEETSWKLKNVCTGEIVQEGTTNSIQACLESDQKYEFTIEDAEGDGMCCDWGEGGYKLYYDGEMVKEGGVFRRSESTMLGSSTC